MDIIEAKEDLELLKKQFKEDSLQSEIIEKGSSDIEQVEVSLEGSLLDRL